MHGWGQQFKHGKGKVNVRGLCEQVLLTAVQAQITLTGGRTQQNKNEGKLLPQTYQYINLQMIMYGKHPLERCNLEKYVKVIVLSTTFYKTPGRKLIVNLILIFPPFLFFARGVPPVVAPSANSAAMFCRDFA